MSVSVGQQLWWVPANRRGQQRLVTVTAVGRKWATLDNHERVALDGLCADGGKYSSPGQCWLSKEEYEKSTALDHQWSLLRICVDRCYSRPSHLTLDQILAIRAQIEAAP